MKVAETEVLRDRTGAIAEIIEPKGIETKMVVLKAEEISTDGESPARSSRYSSSTTRQSG